MNSQTQPLARADENAPEGTRSSRATDHVIPLAEALARLDCAILDSDQTALTLHALDAALACHITSFLNDEPYCDDAFLSSNYRRRLEHIYQHYVQLRLECQKLRLAALVDPLEMKRLRTHLLNTQRSELNLLFEAIWTDTGGVG